MQDLPVLPELDEDADHDDVAESRRSWALAVLAELHD